MFSLGSMHYSSQVAQVLVEPLSLLCPGNGEELQWIIRTVENIRS